MTLVINENLLLAATPTVEEIIIPGQFKYFKDKYTRDMLVNAWQAITLTETWNFVKQPIDSFMTSDEPRLQIINQKMEELGYDGHSGFSFGFTMRTMQYIANEGEERYKAIVMAKNL